MTQYSLTQPLSDLLQQEVKERSINAMLHCPFHEDRTPSFSIHLEEGVWHCFSCSRVGNLESLYRLLHERMDDGLYFQRIARRAADPEIETTHNFSPVSNAFVGGLGTKGGTSLVAGYVLGRRLDKKTVKHYGIGYDTERDALSLPYWDNEGRVTGIKFRHRNGFKSALPGSRFGIYGLGDVLGKSDVIICEGESDTHTLYSRLPERDGLGICGTSGASVSRTQWEHFSIHFLFARRIWLVYDADEAGDKCAEDAMRVLGSDKCIRIRPLRGKDISEHLMNGGTLDEVKLGEADLHVPVVA